MGTWGIGSFENDDAADFMIDALESGDLSLLGEVFDNVLTSTEYVEASDATVAIAAAEIVAAALGRPTPAAQQEEGLTEWLARIRPTLPIEPGQRIPQCGTDAPTGCRRRVLIVGGCGGRPIGADGGRTVLQIALAQPCLQPPAGGVRLRRMSERGGEAEPARLRRRVLKARMARLVIKADTAGEYRAGPDLALRTQGCTARVQGDRRIGSAALCRADRNPPGGRTDGPACKQ